MAFSANMNGLSRSLVLALSVWGLMSSGCTFRQSESVRVASFHPPAGRHIDQVDIEAYLRSRVAILIASDENLSNRWAAGDLSVPGHSNLGCAVAIDRRGYFLTAAHCLKHQFVYLILYEPETPETIRALRVRVVWQGKRCDDQPDLAVLHVQHPPAHVFDWGGNVLGGEPVMAVGLSWTNKSNRDLRGFEFMGGKILDCRKLQGEAGDFKVATDVPLQSGDSGGPLVDAGGRLIGINVQGTPPLIHRLLPSRMFPMVAERPSQKWLSEIIEADATRQ